MQFTFIRSEHCTACASVVAVEQVCQRTHDLEDLICGCLCLNHELVLYSFGAEDGDRTLEIVVETFEGEKLHTMGKIQVPVSEVTSVYPPVPALEGCITKYPDDMGMPCDEYTSDEWFDVRDRHLGIRWDSDYGHAMVSRTRMVEFMLVYALSANGIARIQKWPKEWLSEICVEFETVHGFDGLDTNVGMIMLEYTFSDRKRGWGECCGVVLTEPATNAYAISCSF